MSFFENNRERVRSDLLKLLHDEEELPSTPCSKNSTCDIDSDDSDDSDVDDILEETSNVFKSLKKDAQPSPPLSQPVKDIDLKIDEKTINDFKLDEDEDEFINNLIDQDLEDETEVKTFVDEKPYKIEIFSSFEPDDEYQEPKKVDICNTEYIDFDAFYENYIENTDDKQFEIFNDIIVENLIQSDDKIHDIVSDFRRFIVQDWVKHINTDYITDPKKWVNRADTILFDMYQKQSLLEYIHHLAKLLVLFDTENTFGLNEHMYVEIGNKAIEPVDMKKYKLDDLMEYYTKGKAVSRILVQDVTDNIKIKQNIKTLNLLIELYNKITDSNIKPLDECNGSEEMVEKVKEQLLQQQQQHLNLNRPIIYVEPKTKKIFVFDYRKLNEKFADGDKINPYTNEEFCQEFIDLCSQKMKNHMLCVFCKDKLEEKNILKTIYLHPKYGPIVLKFCDATCMSDQSWNNKSLQNAIIGIV
jgi:hypothetical protein